MRKHSQAEEMASDQSSLGTDSGVTDAKATVEIRTVLPAYPFLEPPLQNDELGRLGSYRVLRLLGQGGMAYVFLAEDRHLRRRVALKVMKPSLACDPAGDERFLREARLLASIKHEHIVTVYQVSQELPTVFLAMEWLRGQTLDDWIRAQGPPPVPEILRITREISCGLDVIHSNGLIHRDLKPNNIWVEEPRQHIKLLDFGLVRSVTDDGRLTGSGFVIGTPGFMSPEQARGHHLDARSDLFSLGAVLYYVCTGRLPFESDSSVGTLTAVVLDHPKPVNQVNPRISRLLSDLVMQLLEKSPDNRPGSADEVIRRVEAIRKSDLSHETEVVLLPTGKIQIASPATEPIEQIESLSQTGHSRKPIFPGRRAWRPVLLCVGIVALLVMIFGPWGLRDRARTVGINSIEAGEAPADAVAGQQARPGDAVGGFLVLDDCDPELKPREQPGDRLTLVDENGAKKFRVTGFDVCQDISNAHRMASDPARGCFWVLENDTKRIRRVDYAGVVTQSIKTEKTGSAIAVDPETGNIWTLLSDSPFRGKTVVYSPAGEKLAMLDHFGTDIVYDRRAKAFWIAGPSLTRISADMKRTNGPYDLRAWTVTSLDVDVNDGTVWVATRDLVEKTPQNQILHVDVDGEQLHRINVGADHMKKVSVDARDGSVWVVHNRQSVDHYSRAGKLLVKHPLDGVLTAEVDDRTGELWVVTRNDTGRLDAHGKLVSPLRHPTFTSDAWIIPVYRRPVR